MVSAILMGGGLGALGWWGWDHLRGPVLRVLAGTGDTDQEGMAWDLGPSLPRGVMLLLRSGSALAAAVLVAFMTHNVGEALVLGFLGSTIPLMILNRQRRQRRIRLDTQCYTMANSLRLLLPVSANTVEALRDARDNSEEPLRGVLSAALRSETRTTGTVTEFLRQVGHDLHLADMELLGDVLLQVRTQTTRASTLLENLVAMWGNRLQVEQKRLGKMSSSSRLGIIMIVISIGIQVIWPAVSASARQTDGHLLAQVFGFFAALVTAGAWMTLMGQTRKATGS